MNSKNKTRKRVCGIVCGVVFSISSYACAGEIVERGGGFAYEPPDGWNVIEGGNFSEYQICLGEKVGNFTPNINVVTSEWAGTLGDYVNQGVGLVRKQRGAGLEVVKVVAGLTSEVEPFVLLVAKGMAVNPADGEPLRSSQAYFYGSGSKKIVITFSIPASASDEQDKLFFQMLKTVRILHEPAN